MLELVNVLVPKDVDSILIFEKSKKIVCIIVQLILFSKVFSMLLGIQFGKN